MKVKAVAKGTTTDSFPAQSSPSNFVVIKNMSALSSTYEFKNANNFVQTNIFVQTASTTTKRSCINLFDYNYYLDTKTNT